MTNATATLRTAAARMRTHVQHVLDEMDRRPDYWNPSLNDTEAYSEGVDSGLGGPAGVLAAAWHPGVALATADLLDAAADDFEWIDRHNAIDPDDDGRTRIMPHHLAVAALRIARAYLGEANA